MLDRKEEDQQEDDRRETDYEKPTVSCPLLISGELSALWPCLRLFRISSEVLGLRIGYWLLLSVVVRFLVTVLRFLVTAVAVVGQAMGFVLGLKVRLVLSHVHKRLFWNLFWGIGLARLLRLIADRGWVHIRVDLDFWLRTVAVSKAYWQHMDKSRMDH